MKKMTFLHVFVLLILMSVPALLFSQTGNVSWEIFRDPKEGSLTELRNTQRVPSAQKMISSLFYGQTAAGGFNYSDILGTDDANGYQSRTKGYFFVTEEASFLFGISSDDQSELWINTEGFSSDGMTKITGIDGWSSVNSFTFAGQPVTLPVGIYSFVCVHDEGSGGDHVQVVVKVNGGNDAYVVGTPESKITLSQTAVLPPSFLLPDRRVIYIGDEPASVHLTDVSDGDPLRELPLSFSLASTTGCVGLSEMDHDGSASSASFTIAPAKVGNDTIVVTLSHTGEALPGVANTFSDTLYVQVLDPMKNYQPTIDVVPNMSVTLIEGEQVIQLTGISDGDEKWEQPLSVTATSSNQDVVDQVQISYTSPSETGELRFTPKALGTTEITVTVADEDTERGNESISITFRVEVTELGNKGFIEDFEEADALEGWDIWWPFNVALENGTMRVSGTKDEIWESLTATIADTAALLDLSKAPYLSFKVRSNVDVNIAVALGVDYGQLGDGSDDPRNKLDAYPQRIRTVDALQGQEVKKGEVWQELFFDYTGVEDEKFSLSKVNSLLFNIAPYTTFPNGAKVDEFVIYIDDIRLGLPAKQMPSVTQVDDISFTVRESGTPSKQVVLRNITDGSDDKNKITIHAESSNTELLGNDGITVDYDGYSRSGKLLLHPNDNVVGESEVTVSLTAPGVKDVKTMRFKVKSLVNQAPFMDKIADVDIARGKDNVVMLTGVSDGNGESEQEITISAVSDNTAAIPDPEVLFQPTAVAGQLHLKPADDVPAGTKVKITVDMKDDGGTLWGGVDTSQSEFFVTVYESLNGEPTLAAINDVSEKAIAGAVGSVLLTGIGDGDDDTQKLTFSVTSSDDRIATDFAVAEVQDGTALLSYRLTGEIGSAEIVVKMEDDGANAGNNGNKSVERSFKLTTLEAPLTYYEDDFNDGTVEHWNGEGDTFTIDEVDGALYVTTDIKPQTYPGINVDLKSLTGGKEIDLSQNPFISLRVKGSPNNQNITNGGKQEETQLTIALVDHLGLPGNGAYTTTMSTSYMIPNDGLWHDVTIDYRGLMTNTETGAFIDSTRINAILINLDCYWFQAIKGEYWFDDLKIGDVADNKPTDFPVLKMGRVADQISYKDEVPKSVTITDITEDTKVGKPQLTASLFNKSLISNVSVSSIVNGSAQISYSLVAGATGTDSIRVVLDVPESDKDIPDTLQFKVHVIDSTAMEKVEVVVDKSMVYQTVVGIGGMMENGAKPYQVEQVKELGYTMMRLTGGEIEMENDNDDPFVLDMDRFNASSLPLDNIAEIYNETQCKKFFYTSWTPPAWMKYIKSQHPHMNAQWVDNNTLIPELQDEFAEYVLGINKAFKEMAGVELFGFSLQNEPEFNEPYGSCKMSGNEFRDIMKKVGARFEQEGLNTLIVMPEDIATSFDWVSGKVNPVINDPESRKYFSNLSVHAYDPDGIGAGVSGTGAETWRRLRELAEQGGAEYGLWQTETSGYTNLWEGEWIKDYMHGTSQFTPGPLVLGSVIYRAFKYGHISVWVDYHTPSFLAGNDLLAAVTKHYTKTALPGARMVEAASSDDNLYALSFLGEDDMLNLLLINTEDVPKIVNISGEEVGRTYNYFVTHNYNAFTEELPVTNGCVVLPPRSIASLMQINANLPPKIDAVPNQEHVKTEGQFTVELTGIDDGDAGEEQALTISASTPNEEVVKVVSVEYEQGASTALIHFDIVDFGTTEVTVTVKDDGGTEKGGVDTKSIVFNVRIKSAHNNAPTVKQVEDITLLEDDPEQELVFEGITDGDDDTQNLTARIEKSNGDLFEVFDWSFDNATRSAKLRFKSHKDLFGTSEVKLVLTDDGGNEHNNGNQTAEMAFNITYLSVNDAPSAKVTKGPIVFKGEETKWTNLLAFSGNDPETEQVVTVRSVTSDNEALLPDESFEVEYRSSSGAVLHITPTPQVYGTAMVTVVIEDDGGIEHGGVDSASYSFPVEVYDVSGIDRISVGKVTLWPNPADDYITILLPEDFNGSLLVFDMKGKLQREQSVRQSGEFRFDVSGFSSGNYILLVRPYSGDGIRLPWIKR